MRALALLVLAGCFSTPPPPDFGDAGGPAADGKPACLGTGDVMGVAIVGAFDSSGDRLIRASKRGLDASLHVFDRGPMFDAMCPSFTLVLDPKDLDPALGAITVEAMTYAEYQGRPTIFVYASRGSGTGATLFEVDATGGRLALTGHFTQASAPGAFNVASGSVRPAFVAYSASTNLIWFGGGTIAQVVPTSPTLPSGVASPAAFSPARAEGWFGAAPFSIAGGYSMILVGARASYQALMSQMIATSDPGPRTGGCDNGNLGLCVKRIVHPGPGTNIVTSIDISGALEFVDADPASRFQHIITTMMNEPIVDFAAGEFTGGGNADVVVLQEQQGAPSSYILSVVPNAILPTAAATFALENRTLLGTEPMTQVVAGTFGGVGSGIRVLVLGPNPAHTKCYRLMPTSFIQCQ